MDFKNEVQEAVWLIVAEAADYLLIAGGAIGPTGMHGCEQNEQWGMFAEIEGFLDFKGLEILVLFSSSEI